MFKLLCLLQTANFAGFFGSVFALNVSMQAYPDTVGAQQAILTISMETSQPLPQSGGFRVSVPTEIDPQKLNCFIQEPKGLTLESCKLSDSKQDVTMTVAQSVQAFSKLVIKIAGVRNPASTYLNKDYRFFTFDESFVTVETVSALSLQKLSPGILTDFAVYPRSKQLGAETMLTIEMKVGSELPCQADRSGCLLTIKNPVRNPKASGVGAQRETVFNSGRLSCQAIDLYDYATDIPCQISQEDLYIYQLHSSPMRPGQSLKLQIQGFGNPVFPQPIQGFQISTQDSKGGLIEQTSPFEISVKTPAQIKDVKFQLSPNHSSSSNKVLEKSQLVLDFAMPVPLAEGCVIKVKIPQDFTQVYQSVKTIHASGMFGSQRSLPFKVSSQVIEIKDACKFYTDNSIRASIKLSHVFNPSSCRDTEPLLISIYDKDGNHLAQTGSAFVIKATEFEPAELSFLAFEASNPTVQESSDLKVTFKTKNRLSQHAGIEIELPKEFSVSSNCQVETLTVQTMRSDCKCQVNQGYQSFAVMDLFYSYGYDPNVDQEVTINFKDIIQSNPKSVHPELTFKLTTFDKYRGKYSQVDSKYLKVKNFNVPGTFKDFSMTFDSSLSNNYPTSGTLKVVTNHLPSANQATLRVTFPNDFRLAESQVSVRTSKGFSAFNPPFALFDSNTVDLQSDQTLTSGSQLIFTLSAIQMPRYQGKGENQIRVQLLEQSSKNLIDEAYTSYFIEEATVWDDLQLAVASDQNLAPTTIAIKFDKSKTRILLQPGDSFVFILPKEVAVDVDNLECLTRNAKFKCYFSPQDHTIIVPDLVERPTTISTLGGILKIKGLFNPRSVRVLTSMTFNLRDRKSRVVIKGSEGLIWQTSQAAPLAVRLEQVSTKPLEAAPYVIKPIAENGSFESAYVSLTFPECMSFSQAAQDSLEVQDADGIYYQVVFASNTKLRVLNRNAKVSTIILKNIVNPTELCTLQQDSAITVRTYEDEEFRYLQSTYAAEPSLGCDPTCLSCLQTDKSVCTQCADDHFLTDEQRCTRTCAPSFYQDKAQQTCIACNSDCLSCSGSPDICSSCKDPEMLLSEQGLCYKTTICLQNQFLTPANECADCSNLCETCSGSEPDQCLSCKNDFILLKGNCVEQCPTDLDLLGPTYKQICEDRFNQASFWQISGSLLRDFKCSYTLLACLLLLIVFKITCLKKMSLLVAMVVCCANFEAIALYVLIYQIHTSEKEEEYLQEFEANIFKAAPLMFAFISILLNISVTSKYLQAIKTKVENSVEETAVYSKWSGKIFTCPRVACLASSVLLSFQNTAWLNIRAQLPLILKRRLFIHRFTEDYARASKLANILPGLFVQFFALYFGVFYAFGRLESRELQVAVLDLGLMSTVRKLLMLIALNFQWQSRTLIKKALDNEETEIETKGLFRTRNSIALHNLRLSAEDKKELERRKASLVDSNAQQEIKLPSRIRNSISVKKFFEAEAKILDKKRDSQAAPPQNPGVMIFDMRPEPVKQEKKKLDFAFLHNVKETIMQRRAKRNESQSPNQTVKTTRGKKLQLLQQIKKPIMNRRRSQNFLFDNSPTRLAKFHAKIDDQIQMKSLTPDQLQGKKPMIDLEQIDVNSSATQKPQMQLVKDFSITSIDEDFVYTQQNFESNDKANTIIDESAYSTNDKFITPINESPMTFSGPSQMMTAIETKGQKKKTESSFATSKQAIKANRAAKSLLIARDSDQKN